MKTNLSIYRRCLKLKHFVEFSEITTHFQMEGRMLPRTKDDPVLEFWYNWRVSPPQIAVKTRYSHAQLRGMGVI